MTKHCQGRLQRLALVDVQQQVSGIGCNNIQILAVVGKPSASDMKTIVIKIGHTYMQSKYCISMLRTPIWNEDVQFHVR